MVIFANKIPDKTQVNCFPDGGIQIKVGLDNQTEILQGEIFHRMVERVVEPDGRAWERNIYSSIPDINGLHKELRALNGGSLLTIKDSNGRIISENFLGGKEHG